MYSLWRKLRLFHPKSEQMDFFFGSYISRNYRIVLVAFPILQTHTHRLNLNAKWIEIGHVISERVIVKIRPRKGHVHRRPRRRSTCMCFFVCVSHLLHSSVCHWHMPFTFVKAVSRCARMVWNGPASKLKHSANKAINTVYQKQRRRRRHNDIGSKKKMCCTFMVVEL